MTSSTVIIMAGGSQLRFGKSDVPKQMLDINGTPLMTRTIEQANRIFDDPVIHIVADDQDIINKYEDNISGAMFDPRHSLVHSTKMTVPYWRTITFILLGDVYYTENALMQIKNVPRTFFGDEVEIYGVRILPTTQTAKMQGALTVAMIKQELGYENGKLWNMYYALEGFTEHKLGGNYCLIEDDTQDFDYKDDYVKFLAKHGWLTGFHILGDS